MVEENKATCLHCGKEYVPGLILFCSKECAEKMLAEVQEIRKRIEQR